MKFIPADKRFLTGNWEVDYPLLWFSEIAYKKGIENEPKDKGLIKNGLALYNQILLPIYKHLKGLGLKLRVNSCYRSPAVNKAVGSTSKRSQHMFFQACDCEVDGIDNYQFYSWIKLSGLPFDQLLLEFYVLWMKNKGWIHVSYDNNKDKQRNQAKAIGCKWTRSKS